MKIFHYIAHLFLLNHGTVHTWYENDDLMVGFKCTKCGKIDGIHKSYIKD